MLYISVADCKDLHKSTNSSKLFGFAGFFNQQSGQSFKLIILSVQSEAESGSGTREGHVSGGRA